MEAYFHLVAVTGTEFDVAGLSRMLSARPNVFHHPYDSEATFIICDHPNTAALLRAEPKQNPDRNLASQGTVTLRAEHITVYQQYAAESVRDQIASLIVPLSRSTDCEIANEHGIDVTIRYRAQPERIFADG